MHNWEDKVKMDLKEIRSKGMEWIICPKTGVGGESSYLKCGEFLA